MGNKTNITWTDATYNPCIGCTPISDGCKNCYAAVAAVRMGSENSAPKIRDAYAGLASKGVDGRSRWLGDVRLMHDRLDIPLTWKRPRRIFVGSMTDIFHHKVPDSYLDQVFDVLERASWHQVQILTKRADRGQAYLSRRWGLTPPAHIWYGVTIENQEMANVRGELLLDTPAAVRFVSCEPLLGAVSFKNIPWGDGHVVNALTGEITSCYSGCINGSAPHVHQVIVGGESGEFARIMHADWVRAIRKECKAFGTDVAFHFKQWGAWVPEDHCTDEMRLHALGETIDGGKRFFRMSKKHTGRLLDGVLWDEFPGE